LLIELLKLFRPEILRDHIPRHQFPIADRRKQIFYATISIITGDLLHLLIIVVQ